MKAVLKYFFVTLLVGFSSISFSQNKAKTVTLDGVVVKFDEISEDTPINENVEKSNKNKKYKGEDSLKSSNSVKLVNEISVYTNSKKEFFLKMDLEEEIYAEGSYTEILKTTSKLSYYNNLGKKLWEHSNNLESYNSNIESNGKSIMIRSISPINFTEYLTVYNNLGEQIYSDENILEAEINLKGNAIIYGKEESNNYTLNFFNTTNNIKWSKAFSRSGVNYYGISPNGDYITICFNNYLHVFTIDGIEIWKKPYLNFSGTAKFSSDGKYLVWNQVNPKKVIEIYDCKLGSKISFIDFDRSNKNVNYEYSIFVEEQNLIAFIGFSKNGETVINIKSINGLEYKTIFIKNVYKNSIKIKYHENYLNIFFDDVLVKNIFLNL